MSCWASPSSPMYTGDSAWESDGSLSRSTWFAQDRGAAKRTAAITWLTRRIVLISGLLRGARTSLCRLHVALYQLGYSGRAGAARGASVPSAHGLGRGAVVDDRASPLPGGPLFRTEPGSKARTKSNASESAGVSGDNVVSGVFSLHRGCVQPVHCTRDWRRWIACAHRCVLAAPRAWHPRARRSWRRRIAARGRWCWPGRRWDRAPRRP